MGFVLLAVFIFAVGGLAYTLDINALFAILILVGLFLLCVLIGYKLSAIITKNPQEKLQRATVFNKMALPSIILGVILWIVGFSRVSDSSRVVAISQRYLLFKSVVTPSSLTLVGTFVIFLGITFWLVASQHLPQKPQDKK